MPFSADIVLGLLVLAIIFGGVTLTIQVSSASSVKTERQMVEHYHGNWWSTWHTPVASRTVLISAGTTFSALVLASLIAVFVAVGL